MIQGMWKTVTIAISGTESAEVDLEQDFRKVLVLIPALDDTEVSIKVAKESGGTFFPLHAFDADASGSFSHASSAITTVPIALIFDCGVQFIKVVVVDSQTGGARTFYVRGLN